MESNDLMIIPQSVSTIEDLFVVFVLVSSLSFFFASDVTFVLLYSDLNIKLHPDFSKAALWQHLL